ncbi:MAG: hypothetical protein QOK16_4167 [Solirubrobacteraceae bacterium]|nr:hypothetical protein [Solirubrobacteraceae bacterium]
MSASEQPQLDIGRAGVSAHHQHEQRRANREKQVHDKHPGVGGPLLAVGDGSERESVRACGAGAEEHTGKVLARCLHDGVVVLHDRRIPRSRVNIDHIAVARSGIWVIDSERYTGKVAISKPLFGKVKLTIAGRDKTKLVESLTKQLALAEAVMPDIAPGVPVRGALCFVEADLPVLGRLAFNGYPLLSTTSLAKCINANGPITEEDVPVIAAQIAERFPLA